MSVLEILQRVRSHLEANGRISLRMLRRELALDGDTLAEVGDEPSGSLYRTRPPCVARVSRLSGLIHTGRSLGMDHPIRKKTLNLDHARLARARRILAQGTDTATIHAALDWVIEGQGVVDDMLAVAGKGRGLFRPAVMRQKKRRSR